LLKYKIEKYIMIIIVIIIFYETMETMDPPIKTLGELYVESLSPKEYKAYLIAKSHLGTSFHLEKSVGFLKWKKKREETI
jgi:hypothetical protein